MLHNSSVVHGLQHFDAVCTLVLELITSGILQLLYQQLYRAPACTL